jgi:hypothetical protein
MQLFQPLVCGLLPVGNLCYLLWSRSRGKPAAAAAARALSAKLFHEYLFAARAMHARGEFLSATLSVAAHFQSLKSFIFFAHPGGRGSEFN